MSARNYFLFGASKVLVLLSPALVFAIEQNSGCSADKKETLANASHMVRHSECAAAESFVLLQVKDNSLELQQTLRRSNISTSNEVIATNFKSSPVWLGAFGEGDESRQILISRGGNWYSPSITVLLADDNYKVMAEAHTYRTSQIVGASLLTRNHAHRLKIYTGTRQIYHFVIDSTSVTPINEALIFVVEGNWFCKLLTPNTPPFRGR